MKDETHNTTAQDPHPVAHTRQRPTGLVVTGAMMLIGITASSILAVRTMQQSLDKVYAAAHGGTPELNPNANQEPSSLGPAAPTIVRGNATRGKIFFNMSCFVCHGPTGIGVPGLGPTLRESKFVASHNDEQLAAFVKVGRQPGDPNTVLNLTMPPKGGNPMLDDTGLFDVVSFVRTLQAKNR